MHWEDETLSGGKEKEAKKSRYRKIKFIFFSLFGCGGSKFGSRYFVSHRGFEEEKLKTLLIECWQKWSTVGMWEYYVTSYKAIHRKKTNVTLVHINFSDVNKTFIDTNRNTEQKLRNIDIYHPELSVYDKRHKPWHYIMCSNLWIKIYTYILIIEHYPT